tara:strand:+ start:3486 stop:4502 length:1017 start_codon:yes stop_codon:yes gene_type:complete
MRKKNNSNFNTSFLKGKTILVTGGTGTFGSNFIETLLRISSPKKIIVFSRDEFKQSELSEKLKALDKNRVLRFFIGDIRDYDRLHLAFQGVDYIVHTAALKQIISNEYNPFECIKTNVYGSENIVRAALNTSVKMVLALSTDKACSPANLYGASKLAADKIFLTANFFASDRMTKFRIVRYGNVLGSRGSVVPYFKKLKKQGSKTIPITDKRMTRFWIKINDAVNFVISSLSENIDGHLFIPKLPSIKITDLAKVIVPNKRFEYIGIRPGEKLHEILINKEETRFAYEFNDRFVLKFQENNSRKFNRLIGGKKVKENFEYSSDKNIFLSLKQIQEFIK